MPNKALHRTAIPLRFIASGELDRWAVKGNTYVRQQPHHNNPRGHEGCVDQYGG